MLIDESDLPSGLGNHCLFAFVLWCGNRSVSIFCIIRHLVIAPIRNTKKPLAADTSISTAVFQLSSNMTRKVEVDRIKTVRINWGIEMGKFLWQ